MITCRQLARVAPLRGLLLLSVVAPCPGQSLPRATPIAIGVLQPSRDHAGEFAAAGVSQVVLSVSWERFEPAAGKVDSVYAAALRSEADAYRAAGLGVVLDLGVQYQPAWLLAPPDARYRNQYGDDFVDKRSGMNIANSVFNAEVRRRQSAHLANLFRELGNRWIAVRLGGGWYGELNYPHAVFGGRDNCYWAFDDLAQGRRPGLPDGVAACPVPGWKPGVQSAGHDSARRFAEWYLESLKNYHDWQIADVRRHNAGPLQMLYPSWGIRPGQLDAAIADDLAGQTPPEKNGEIQRGFDFARFIGGIRDPRVVVHCTWFDSNPEWSDEASDDHARWSPAHFLADLAASHQPVLTFTAENTGGGGPAALDLCARRVQALHPRALYWAFGPDLFDGKPPELRDLKPALAP